MASKAAANRLDRAKQREQGLFGNLFSFFGMGDQQGDAAGPDAPSTPTPKEDGDEVRPGFRARRLSVTNNGSTPSLRDSTLSQEESVTTPSKPRQKRISLSPEKGKLAAQPLFTLEMVGTFSCHGAEPSRTGKGSSSKINQDRGCVVYPFGPREDVTMALFGVCDGHGGVGDKCSEFVVHDLKETLWHHPKLYSDPPTALKESFVSVDKALGKSAIDAELSGTTAVFVLYVIVDGKHLLYTANAGASYDS